MRDKNSPFVFHDDGLYVVKVIIPRVGVSHWVMGGREVRLLFNRYGAEVSLGYTSFNPRVSVEVLAVTLANHGLVVDWIGDASAALSEVPVERQALAFRVESVPVQLSLEKE